MSGRGTPAVASFPTSVWDGTSNSRTAAQDGVIKGLHREPDGDDMKQIIAEVAATQTMLNQTILRGGFNNSAAVALAATSGHAYLPSCAGTPTGVPAVITGYTAVLYDTTAHKIWAYDAGWKATSALA